jgi:hypothetical protein
VSGMLGEKVNVSQICNEIYLFSYEMVSETYIVIGDKKHLSFKKFVCTKKIVPRVKLSILSKTMCEKKIKNEKK